MKTKILFSYPTMMVGGSTTSLLSILSRIDYSKYEIDLLLDVVGGELMEMIPKEVNVLESAYTFPDYRIRKLRNIFSPAYMFAYLKAREIFRKSGNFKHGVQYIENCDVERYRKITKHYDVAVAFLEGKNCKFVSRHISADKKIAWIHIDYLASGFDPAYDIESMRSFDSIVTVSNSCLESFNKCFPQLSGLTCVIENILSSEVIRKRSEQYVDFNIDRKYLNLVTTCRIKFSSKGLDRGVIALANNRSKKGFERLRWYIIGDGPDMQRLKQMIQEYNLADNIILLGNQLNPYSFMKNMDLFFLPSLWEGKPMAVTEALMLGLPILASNYLSAHEQIRDGIDGIIVDNSQSGLNKGISYILENKSELAKLKSNVQASDYSNDSEMMLVNGLLDSKL